MNTNKYYYVYKTSTPVEIVPDTAPFAFSWYLINYEIQEFVREYASHIAKVRIPDLDNNPFFLPLKQAQRIGKAMNTQENAREAKYSEWLIRNIGYTMLPQQYDMNSIWKMKHVFLHGGRIQIQRCIPKREMDPLQGWGYWTEEHILGYLSWKEGN